MVMIVARDSYRVPLDKGQRVRVKLGNPGETETGKVTEVNMGFSSFITDAGVRWMRPNEHFTVLGENDLPLGHSSKA